MEKTEDKKPRKKRNANWGLRETYSGVALPYETHLAIKPKFLTAAFVDRFRNEA